MTGAPDTRGTRLSRRRFIGIAGAAACLGLSPRAIAAGAHPAQRWRGVVLGAVAELRVAHPDAAVAEAAIAASRAEIERLETIFSLYRSDSAVSKLNRDGVLRDPPADLLRLLSLCGRVNAASGGAFDPTIQPLWRLYAGHFSRNPSASDGPPPAAIAAARSRVGWHHLRMASDRISFGQGGCELTLNGIAQGYIGDRVAGLMRRMGVGRALVNLGEISAIGDHPDGRPWNVGIADPVDPDRTVGHLPLTDFAVATSGGYGTRFDAAGTYHHILDPRSGRSPQIYSSVSVTAPSAAIADGLSTAALLISPHRVKRLMAQYAGASAYVVGKDGRLRNFNRV